MFNYEAQDDDELTVVVGEVLTIEYEDSGWYIGINNAGMRGRFPSNYCDMLT